MAPERDLRVERIRELESRLAEAEETLNAIRTGSVDAFLGSGPDGDVVYTLQGADTGYRLFVENMAEGALTVATDGLILFTNEQFARLLHVPHEQVIGSYLRSFVAPRDHALLEALLGSQNGAKAELGFNRADGEIVPVHLSAARLCRDGSDCLALIVTDLTEQKRNQEIFAAGKIARTILEQTAVPIVVTDPQGRIIQANRAVEQLTRGPVLLRDFDTVFDLRVSTEDSGLKFAGILAMLDQRPNISGLQASVRTDGDRSFDVLINAASFGAASCAGAGPETLGCVVVLVDITERKLALERLRESYRFLNLLLDQSPLAVIESDSDLHITRWTGTAKQVFGWRAEEMLGRRLDEIPLIHPEDRYIAERGMSDMLSSKRPSSIMTTRNLRKDSSVIYCEWYNSSIYDDNGHLVAVLSRVLDVTERRRAEEALHASNARFEKLHESNVIGIISADESWIYEANDLFLKMLGYTREEFAKCHIDWRKATPPEYQAAGDRAMRQLAESGSFTPFEKEYIAKDGARIPVMIGGTLLERENLRHICFVLDLTDRKKLESKLQEKDKLESLGLLAGGIAHDFNNLLVGIMGNAGLAQEMAPEDSALANALDSIVKCSQSAAHLTRQMLAYAGKGRFVVEHVNLSSLAEETLQLVRSAIPSGASLHLDLNNNLAPVEADASQMQQVVMNLVMNAAEAIGDQSGVVALRTANCVLNRAQIHRELWATPIEPGSYVMLEVRDSGCGMDEATRARIFDPFFSTKFMGRGLGLAAVAGIVRSHKGAIRVTSGPGKGSTFTVYFPAAVEQAAITESPSPTVEAPRGSETVLVVDDEPMVLETAKLSLERRGYTVLTAESGKAGIEILTREGNRVALVLLDLSMPQMSGQDTLRELLKINPDLDVLVSSGYTESETMRFFAGLRVCGFVQKPYTPVRLARQVGDVLAFRCSPQI